MRLGQVVTLSSFMLLGRPVDHLPRNTGRIVGADVEHPEFLFVEWESTGERTFVLGSGVEEVEK
jgi:hypothetical protein